MLKSRVFYNLVKNLHSGSIFPKYRRSNFEFPGTKIITKVGSPNLSSSYPEFVLRAEINTFQNSLSIKRIQFDIN